MKLTNVAILASVVATSSTAMFCLLRKRWCKPKEIIVGYCNKPRCFEVYAKLREGLPFFVLRTENYDLARRASMYAIYETSCRSVTLAPIRANVPVTNKVSTEGRVLDLLTQSDNLAKVYKKVAKFVKEL